MLARESRLALPDIVLPLRTFALTLQPLTVAGVVTGLCLLAVAASLLLRAARRVAREAAQVRAQGEALRRSEARYRLLAESMHDIVALLDVEGRVLFVSPSVTDRLGWAVEEVAGRAILDFVHPEDRPRIAQRLHVAFDPRDTAPISWRCLRADGEWRWLETHTSSLRSESEPGRRWLCTSRDVTDRKSLEEQLRQAQKMEAVGRLAGGVAHDFNNLLTVIIGYAAALELEHEGMPAIAQQAGEIRGAAERAARLTQQLLAFSRQQVLQLRVVDLDAVVQQASSLLGRLMGPHVALTTALDTRGWAVRVDPGQIEQVLMNLVVNARDAMPEGGTITIATRQLALGVARREQGVLVPAGDWVVLEVQDTGEGMAPAVCARIFEPFFTTKPAGSGTGLGLPTAYGIVKQSGGFIFCDSTPEAGTRMRVYLPRADAVAERPGNAPHASGRDAGTLLVVDDEPAVRSLVASLLRVRGYAILEAGSGAEALERLRAHGPVDLVLMDVVMPGMNGVEAARRVAALCPQASIVFMSGYAENVLPHEAVAPGAVFLQKPFAPDVLVSRVREVLDTVRR